MDNYTYTPAQRSYFTLTEKIKLRVWMFVNSSLFRYTPYFSHRVRIFLLKLFGAKIAWNCSISRKALIEQPWNLEMKGLSSLAEGVWLLCREKVFIGSKRVRKGQDIFLRHSDSEGFKKNISNLER